MARYNKRLVNKICQLIRSDSYTIAEICTNVGISESCFYHWQAGKEDFREAIARARGEFDELLVKEAKKSLMKKVKGYTVQEKHTTYVDAKDKSGESKPKIREQKIVDKHFQPDTMAIQFVLTNKVPEEFKNRQTSEVTISNLSDEELDKRIKDLEQQLAKNK